MKKIKIMNEFLHGPVWYCDDEGFEWDNKDEFLPFINDKELNDVADKINEMYSGYFEFDSHGVACWFNKEQQRKDASKMLVLLKRLKARIDELNDGTFLVEDHCIEFYEDLAVS